MSKIKTITLNEEDHATLQWLTKKLGAKSMRSLLGELINRAASQTDIQKFEKAVNEVIRQSEDPVGLREYLTQSYISELLMLLDDTRPSYRDVVSMQATLKYWEVNPLEFFETLLTYAKFGLSELKEET